jgi:hypothetical protein
MGQPILWLHTGNTLSMKCELTNEFHVSLEYQRCNWHEVEWHLWVSFALVHDIRWPSCKYFLVKNYQEDKTVVTLVCGGTPIQTSPVSQICTVVCLPVCPHPFHCWHPNALVICAVITFVICIQEVSIWSIKQGTDYLIGTFCSFLHSFDVNILVYLETDHHNFLLPLQFILFYHNFISFTAEQLLQLIRSH